MSNAQKSIALVFLLAVISIGKNVYGNDLGEFKKISFTVAHAGSSQATNEAYQEGSYDNNDINTGAEDHVKFYGNTDHDKGEEHHSQEKYNKEDVDDAKYAYKYGVKDSTTGDMKDHWEIRDGDRVKGKLNVHIHLWIDYNDFIFF